MEKRWRWWGNFEVNYLIEKEKRYLKWLVGGMGEWGWWWLVR